MAKPFLPVLSAVLLLAQGASALVYLDPANGDDANGGLSEAAPVKTFERARELAQGGDVSLMGTISVTADTAFDLDGGVLRRYISTDGTVTNLADLIYSNTQGIMLTFSHIVVEGIGTETKVTGRLVTAAKANVVLAAGATLRNSFAATAPAGVTCATLTMTGDSRIEHCRLENGGTQSGAGALVSGLLRMTDTAFIGYNTNYVTTSSSVAGQCVAGGAYVGSLEMDGHASVVGNWSRTGTYLYGTATGGAGVYVKGAGTSVIRGNATIAENLANYQRGGGIAFPSGILVLADSASIVSNSTIPLSQNNPGGQALYGGTLIMSNRACIAFNGLKAPSQRHEDGDGCVNVGCLLMHDDTCIVSNKARTIGGAVVRGGGGMFDRARIAFNESTYFSSYCMSGGLLVSGGEFTMNDDAVIEGNDSATKVYGGVCVQNTGRFVLNGGTIRNNRGGILISPTANGGEVILAGGFVTNNTYYGIKNGAIPYTGKLRFGGIFRMTDGVVGYNGGYGFMDDASCPATNYYRGGLVVGNTSGGARFVDVGGAHCLAGTPRFEDAVKFTKPDQRFIVDGRLRTGTKVPIILKALNSKNNEIEALTAANDYGLDMDQDGTRRPRIVAVPDGENVTDAGRWAKYFSLANTLPEGVIRYCNAVGTSVGLSDRRPSEGVVIMLR